jgi:5'(3')-deoxyribonucleotidase
MQKKPILYFDMDNVLVDFTSGIARLPQEVRQSTHNFDEVNGIFSLMDPMPGAIEAVHKLKRHFDIYVLSTCPWKNISGASDKVAWIKKHFGEGEGDPFYKRIILSHHKNLNKGDFIIDDRTARGVDEFEGEHIHFGTDKFPDWQSVVEYLLSKTTEM